MNRRNRSMNNFSDELTGIIQECYKPRKEQKVWEWIEENCELPPESGAKLRGPIDTGIVAYTREIYEAYADNAIRFLTLAKSAQVGGTTVLKNLVLWDIAHQPNPGIYYTATKDLAVRFNDRELEPHFKYCREVENLAVRERGKWRKLDKLFANGATITLRGSNSPSNLASIPALHVKMDEVDKWPDESERETSAVQLAIARTKTYEEIRKIFIISTPTIENGVLWQYYLKGSQERYHVPCPFCGFKQELHFYYTKGKGGLWWPDDCRRSDGYWDLDLVRQETRYRCANCDGLIHNNRKIAMNSEGAWEKNNPRAPFDHRSFHISALYSPFETWGGVAAVYLESKDVPGRMHDFDNNYLGMPYIRKATTILSKDIMAIVESSPKYERGQLPVKPRLITMTVDVQQENFWWTIRAWVKGRVSYLLDFGSAISYHDLENISRRLYEYEGNKYKIWKVMIDSGYAARSRAGVYDWCLATCGRFFPAKGVGKNSGLTDSWRDHSIKYGESSLILTNYDDDIYKEELYCRRIKERSEPRWYLPQDINHEYIEQLTDEHLVERPSVRGNVELVWERARNNHLGDCEKMQLVVGDMVSGHLNKPEPKAEDPNDSGIKPGLVVDIPPSEWS